MGKRKVLICGIAVAVMAVFVFLPCRMAPARRYGGERCSRRQGAGFYSAGYSWREIQTERSAGKPVLLIFGTTWCPSCRDEIPHLKDIYARYAKKGLIMVNIDIQESRDKVSRYADKYELPYRVLLDENGDLAQTYGIRGVPTLILLDEEGMIAGGQRFIDPLLATMLKGKKL